MQVALLKSTIDDFARALAKGWSSGLEPLYQSIPHWQAAWPPSSPAQLPATLDAALANNRTRAFWQGSAYYPKEVLIQFAEFAPEMVNMAFGRLFNETVDLGDRYSGFAFYLDELLAELHRVQPLKAPNTHYHDDHRASSLYTALRFPATHAYYEGEVYLRALTALRAPQVGTVAEPSRFAKTVKVAMTFLGKHEGVQRAHVARLQADDYAEPSALLASEYFRFLSDS